ncbi:CbtA family protein [Paractinoplanes atraurantiacus]|uniref:Probable cobalt transporter subunit (CbtA) n=1 Tax=Paractinoplanes atraurantiacus TaxID=1036182 RepID=A0A285IBJ3_9ACTN|nr:CbtA family protein [Actinoplanes atraurantiacus]SNY45338.1 Probable cobalt transporter subunit (CbtA) [Actinoplanes atraurantiacus]
MPLTEGKPALGYGALLIRGLLAGLIAGLLAGCFAYVAGEPKVDAAIAIEEANAHADGAAADHHDEELVGRDAQKGGLFLATGLYGAAMGGLLATAYTLLRRRLRTPSDTRAALSLAGAALLGVVLVPYVKYPPNPPAVGNPATIDQRTISYLAILVIGLVAVWASVVAARTQRAEWRQAIAAVTGFLVVVAVGYLLLPTVDEVPDTFPADLLWNFRLASLGTQVLLWTALGLAFAALLTARRTPATQPGRETVAAG